MERMILKVTMLPSSQVGCICDKIDGGEDSSSIEVWPNPLAHTLYDSPMSQCLVTCALQARKFGWKQVDKKSVAHFPFLFRPSH